MMLFGISKGPRKTRRNRCARKNAKVAGKNRRRRNSLKK